jgi:hypothetical protein
MKLFKSPGLLDEIRETGKELGTEEGFIEYILKAFNDSVSPWLFYGDKYRSGRSGSDQANPLNFLNIHSKNKRFLVLNLAFQEDKGDVGGILTFQRKQRDKRGQSHFSPKNKGGKRQNV